LEGVRAAGSERGREWRAWKWWAAMATAAVVVAFVVIRVANRSHSPVPQTSQAANAVPAPSPRETLKAIAEPAPVAGPATKVAQPKRIAHREGKPSHRVEAHHWPSQFPTPAPLTPEEKALVQYVRETPAQVLAEPILKTELAVQHVEIKPLEIPQLEIEPLALGPAGEEFQ
ncbi:MAG TPA: hypothetical protein VNM47_02970, partial [Terriglobia bacterium]|nr:hypothetical protein [Terriglobia bacterium]